MARFFKHRHIAYIRQIEDGLLYRWIKDASDYNADLVRGDELWKLVTRQKEVKNEAGEVTRPANEPTLHARKSELFFSPKATNAIRLIRNSFSFSRRTQTESGR